MARIKNVVLLFSNVFFVCSGVCYASNHPNIVFILADDLGWDDISLHGSQEIPTPNIDSLASAGIVLNNYYVQPICTPSRAALMTGRHPIHTGMQHNVILSSQPYGVGLNETLLPQYLKELGYKNHLVGKWHLGYFAKEYTPLYRGFDSHLGYYQGCEDYWDHTLKDGGPGMDAWGLDFWKDEEVYRTAFGQYSTEVFTSEAERIIDDHDPNDPLFLYMAHQAVHSGNPGNPQRLQAPWKYIQRFKHIKSDERRVFAAMVSALDDSIGKLMLALNKKGVLENTVVVFSTDNGGPANRQDYNDACNWPLRGSKRTMWEGGVRANGFIWSPLLKTTGYVSKHMIQILDWLPTLLDVAGYNMSALPKNIDGLSQWAALSGNLKGPRKEMLHNIDPINGDGALRIGDMKVVFGAGDTKRYNGWFPPESVEDRYEIKNGSYSLSNLSGTLKNSPQNRQDYSTTSDVHKLIDLMDLKPKTALNRHNTQIVVACGDAPPDVKTSCQPWLKPCLFNITADPCEYHNLADKFPSTLQSLLKRVAEYRATSVKPRNQPMDPNGLPGKLGGVWRPWITL